MLGKEKENLSDQTSFGDDPLGPTTTTKALLVTVLAPCHFSTKYNNCPVIEEDEAETKVEEDPKDVLSERLQTKLSEASCLKKNDNEDGSVAEKENEEEEEETTNQTPPPETDDKEEDLKTGDTLESPINSADVEIDDAEPIREEIKTTESEEITPDEAAAVQVGKDPDDQVIHVEALLRIAFDNLLKEFHLLTVPAYTYVQDKKLLSKAVPDNDSDHQQNPNEIEGEMTSWVRVEVMARPSSLGIILERLERIGIGTNIGSCSVYKAELCRTASPYLNIPEREETKEEDSTAATSDAEKEQAASKEKVPRGFDPEASLLTERESSSNSEDMEKMKAERMLEEARAEWKNAATRLRIEQVREQIAEQAALSFDYISLLCIASILAAIGLITDNTVIIVASMLVSPIMGPVLGLTFGTRIQDVPLVITSFLNETLSLLGCVFIGMLVGLGAGFTDLAQEDWPTYEMESRGEIIGLAIGIAIAVPSGMGVCLSILGGNTSSLVGVAISASLLPPAVNAGVCFMHAILIAAGAVSCDSGKDANDFFVIGGNSFALTVLNIVCIWLAGIIMFEFKEVRATDSKGAFWDRDIKLARQLNKKVKRGEKPPPVDFSVIHAGLKTALAKGKSKDDKKIDEVKIRPPPQGRPRYEQASLNSAFSMRKRRTPVYERNGLWGNNLARVDEDNENVEYVGLEDMAGLLGFDADEDNALIDNAARIGRGRYF